MSAKPKHEPPIFLIVAGPNGSGKSSFYADAALEDLGLAVWITNPDLLAARIHDIEGLQLDAANLQAVSRIGAWLQASIATHQSIGVETVLSTPKYRRLVGMAIQLKFRILLIYVILNDPDLNVARVGLRVLKGGHSVSEPKIRDRYRRSLEELPWFWEHADEAWVFDNSGRRPILAAEKRENHTTGDVRASPAIADAVGKGSTTL